MTFRNRHLIFESTQRSTYIGANDAIGIQQEEYGGLGIYGGYDHPLDAFDHDDEEQPEFAGPPGRGLTPEERKELADHMIRLWTEWRDG